MKLNINNDDNSHFISLSDMMSVLMMIFMLIALISMRNSVQKNEMVKEMVVTYQETQQSLYKDLFNEFKSDLNKWDAEINKDTLSITFNSPDILFNKSDAKLKEKFKSILNDFFPRYISIIENKYKNDIEEIRIEGYTDSDGLSVHRTLNNPKMASYFYNMELSQNRSRNVLEHCMSLSFAKDRFKWLTEKITANGLSFSKLKFNKKGTENKEKSRRVEFRVKTKAETKIRKIIETLN